MSESRIPTCIFISTDQPRMVRGRHLDSCECADLRSTGCWPCEHAHCCICMRAHAKATCTDCLAATRDDLSEIARLVGALPEEAVERGVNSEAMALLGPAADPEAWRNHAMSAVRGRLCRCGERGLACPSLLGAQCPAEAYLEDARDELHPLYVLAGWEQIWRDHLDHYTEAPATLASVWTYLDTQIGYMADQIEPPFDEFARELAACRSHLENVLRDGVREEKGAPCVQCEKPMTRLTSKQGQQDTWRCHSCRREVTEDQYRYAVGVVYRAHSPHLTAVDLGKRVGVKPSVIRVWGSRGHIRKRGRNQDGHMLYDVASTQAWMERGDEAG